MENLVAQLHRLYVIRHVVEVDGCRFLLQELDALHSDLVELFFLSTFGSLGTEYTVLLIWFILLRQDDLFQGHWILALEFKQMHTALKHRNA